ncbi:MAG: adenylate/guanylate cyclase domain-containing protein [Eudoraea sp.]|uniref:adenylate/guanylate cyclase domain-containing protein n=1 Tax=Eudoraea sp. TaxID=1979955 RepID=UPI003C767E34
MNQRILSAVMFTDIVGYSALSSRNEEEALDLVRINRNHQKPIIEKYGVFLKEMGDGMMARFSSASDSVLCAKEIQETAPKELVEKIRIGIHLGDVTENEGDIFGDGVNVASRLESKAAAGRIYISDSVHNAIKGRGDINTKYIGTFKLKNLKDPIKTYVVVKKEEQLNPSQFTKAKLAKALMRALVILFSASVLIELIAFMVAKNNLDEGLVDIATLVLVFLITGYLIFVLLRGKRVALILTLVGNLLIGIATIAYYSINPLTFDPSVLRLVNLDWGTQNKDSQNSVVLLPTSNYISEEKKYEIAGIHDGLINEIGKRGSVRVISKTSSLPYSNTTKSLKTIAQELNVEMLVESSVSTKDTITELTVKLINPFPVEKTIWLNTYSVSIPQISQLYNEVATSLISKINDVNLPANQINKTPSTIINSEAWEYYQLAAYFVGNMTRNGFDKAEEYLNKSIEIDSTFSSAYSGLSFTWMSKKQMGLISPKDANSNIRKYAAQAMQLDNTNDVAWAAQAGIAVWTDYDMELGEKSFQKSIALNPNASMTRAAYAHLLMILNRWDEAWEQMNYALEIDPLNPMVIAFSGAMYLMEGKFLSATKKFEIITAMVPDHRMANSWLLQKYARTFQHKKALIELKKFIDVEKFPGLEESIDEIAKQNGFNDALRLTIKEMTEQSKIRFIPAGRINLLCTLLGDTEGRIFWLEKMYEEQSGDLPYFAIRNDDPIQQDPRYIAVMRKIGLWP